MSVKLASYSYSFSASSYELPQNVYIGRSHHAEHEYDIRFALGQTVWPLEVIKVSENGVPHSSFIYRPNRLKMHQTTCRGPSYGNTQQEPDWTILRSKVKVKYAKNPIFKHGVPHSSFIYRPNRLKMHQTTCRGPSYGNTQQEPDWMILRSKVKVKYAKNTIFKHGVPHSSFIYRPNRLKMHQATCRGPSYGNTEQEPDWRIFRSKVKVNYAKHYIFSHIITHSVHVYCSNWFKTRILFKSGSQFSIQIAKDHLQVKGQGHQLDAGIKIGFKKRGTA